MSAPPKPWEISGAGDSRTFQMPASIDQNLLGQISGNNASQPTALLGPAPGAGQPRRRAPTAPLTAANPRSQLYNAAPAVQSSLAAYGSTYPSTYGNASGYGSAYGNAYGSAYGNTYGSTLGSYGSTLGSYGSALGSYGSAYGSSYGSPYGGYGMGTGYGGYGQRYGGYGMSPFGGQPAGPTAESRLVALAAERSRPTFESIESVVQTVGSVSFMLESTLGALHSSFRAVLAVADHLGRLRAIFSAMAVFRFARYLYARLRQMLGVAPTRGEEAAWGAAAGVGAEAPSGASWPVAAFVAVVVAAPYIAFRLLARLAPADTDVAQGGAPATNQLPAWLSSGQPVWQATSMFDFAPAAPGELAIRANQPVFIAPQQLQTFDNGWVLASDGNCSGLVPKSFIRVARAPTQTNAAAPQSRPAVPTAASYTPKMSPDSMEPEISPGPQSGQPDKDKPTE